MGDFEAAHVNANTRHGAPPYNSEFIEELHRDLVDQAPDLKDPAYSILASIFIGAHRADLVPRLFEKSILDLSDEEQIKTAFCRFRNMLMTVWPFVGIPWIMPAVMGLAKVLENRGLQRLAEGRTRPNILPEDERRGGVLMEKTYRRVGNTDVHLFMEKYYADQAAFAQTVVFGYAMAGTTATGLFQERETQLLVMSAIASSGAARQATMHTKASLGMGNNVAVVKAVIGAVERLNSWNGTPVASINVELLAKGMK